MTQKPKRGRKPLPESKRRRVRMFSLPVSVDEFIAALPEGHRSRFVAEAIQATPEYLLTMMPSVGNDAEEEGDHG